MAAGRKTSDAQKAQFIENLRRCGVVRQAAAASGIGQRTAYDLRAADADFGAAWDDALAGAIGEVEASLREMCVGYVEREFYARDASSSESSGATSRRSNYSWLRVCPSTARRTRSSSTPRPRT